MENKFSITPLTKDVFVADDLIRLDYVKEEFEKKYNGKVSFTTFTVVLPILEKYEL